MTQNQIAFQSLNENRRHNQAMERLSRRAQNINIGDKATKMITDISSILAKALL